MSDYFTPGAAVAGSLENILARKKNEARQSMLDQLAAQQLDAQNQERQSLAQYRQAEIDNLHQRMYQQMAGSGVLQEGEDYTGKLDPGFTKFLKDYGYTTDMLPGQPEAQVSSKITSYNQNPEGETPETYDLSTESTSPETTAPTPNKHGLFFQDPARRKAEEEAKQMEGLITNGDLDPDKPMTIQRAVAISRAMKDPKILEQYLNTMKQGAPTEMEELVTLGPNGKVNATGKKFPKGTVFRNEPNAPQPTAAQSPKWVQGEMVDKTGKTVPAWIDENHPTRPPVPSPGGFRVKPSGGAGSAASKSVVIPPALVSRLATSRKNLEAARGVFGGTPNNLQNEFDTLKNSVVQYGITPAVRAAAAEIYNDPKAKGVPTAQIAADQDDLSPEEQESLRYILSVIRGEK